ncbi:MAG: aldo/keto reductase [Caldilineaceae bacterium]
MQYATIPYIDKPVSRLVQGTMMMHTSREEEGFAVLDACLEAGLNTFDTAHIYAGGECERVLGRWINSRGVRDQVVILGKGAHHSRDRKRVTPFDIAADVHDSLARMQVEQIDLYLLHRDDPTKPVGPIVEALNEQHDAGRIGAFGGSNWSVARIQAANEYAAAHGLKPFVASSPNFSLGVQAEAPWPDCVSLSGPEGAADRQWYLANPVTLFTWSSLAGGFFSGRFRRNNLDSFTESYDQLCVRVYCHEVNFLRLDRVEELANEKGITIPQLALAYVLNQPQKIHALVGSRTPDEVAINVAASAVKLAAQELAWLDLRD